MGVVKRVQPKKSDNRLVASHQFMGFGLAILATVLFSIKPIFVKLAYQYGVDSVVLMTLRMLFSLPFYLVIGCWLLMAKQVPLSPLKAELWPCILVGLLGYYLASYLDLVGLTMVSAQLERIILFIFPTIVVILSRIIYKKPINSKTIGVFIVTYLGVLLIFSHDFKVSKHDTLAGGIYIFASAIAFACYILFSRQRVLNIGSRMFTCIAMGAASLAIVIHFLLTHQLSDFLVSMPVLSIAAMIAFISTVLPSFFVSEAIARLGAEQTSLVSTLGPVITAFLAIVILNESFTFYHAIGMALVMSGIAWLGLQKSENS
ncbi:DMT family transporter [Spartinivicinus poritis]|uniref:DMT family transporter n=1 Tax=Spartinivicinus poritis TaxID=2994640 RepID=A0ABT5U3B8_9GAMM|nr:DMT family transporter [Spartinivicinus sp. A2-2]MDE1460856.1 DMT family transporter [Spartinivicinus sp. A2-2]